MLKPLWYRHVLRWSVGKNVRIGFSYVDARRVSIGDNVRIGHFNVFRNITELSIGEQVWISNSNQFFGGNYLPQYPSILRIGNNCYIMSRHFCDVSGTITLGNRVTLAGRDTQIWSHSLILKDGVELMKPMEVFLQDHAYIGARCTLLMCTVPVGAFVGAGSVVTKQFGDEPGRVLIAGNPAVIKKRY